MEKTFQDISPGHSFPDETSENTGNKSKTRQMGLNRYKKHLHSKEKNQKNEDLVYDEKMSANHTCEDIQNT